MATPLTTVRATLAITVMTTAAALCQPALAEPTASPPAAPTQVVSEHAKPQRLFQRFYHASVRASRAAQHQVAFETLTNANADTSDIVGDAAQSASDAIVAISGWPDGARWLGQVHDVRVAVGAAPAVDIRDGSITVTVCPSVGASGQPSSFDIQHAVEMAARDESPA